MLMYLPRLHFVSLVMRVRKIPPQKYKACSVSLSVKFLEMNYTAHMTSVASKDFFFFFFSYSCSIEYSIRVQLPFTFFATCSW